LEENLEKAVKECEPIMM